jgi:hypothetical protein
MNNLTLFLICLALAWATLGLLGFVYLWSTVTPGEDAEDRLLYNEIHGWLLYPWHWALWPREMRSEGTSWPRWVRIEWFCLRIEYRFEIPTPEQIAEFTEE